MCDRLADFLSQKLDFHDLRVVLELGCGKGQLTIPLANRIGKVVRSFRLIAVDVSSGLTVVRWMFLGGECGRWDLRSVLQSSRRIVVA
jgi:SAM-dependent methyltransferase